MLKRKSAAVSRKLQALGAWQQVLAETLASLPYDLSTRQMHILLAVYLEPPPHSIKALSESLSISKPAVCRAVDTLEHIRFLKRKRDKDDKRNVFLLRTPKGGAFLNKFADIISRMLR